MLWRRLALSIAGLLLANSTAWAIPKLTLVQGTSTPPCGVTVRILVDLQSVSTNAAESQFTVRYKSSCMSFVNATLGANAPPSSFLDTNDLPGSPSFPICDPPSCTSCSTDFDRHVVVLMTPPSGSTYGGTGDKEIVVLNFTAAAAASNCKIEWDQSNPSGLKPTFIRLIPGGDVYGSGIQFVPNASPPNCPGVSIVAPSATLSGTAYYYAPTPLPNTNYVPNVSACANPPAPPPDVCGTSSAGGLFTIPGVVPGNTSMSATKSTEPTDPSTIGGGDVNLLVRALAGPPPTLTPDQQIAADVDESGVPPNSSDLQKLRRYLVFDPVPCPKCATWKFFADPAGNLTWVPVPATVNIPNCQNKTVNLKGILRGDIDSSWPNRNKVSSEGPVALAFGGAQWNGLEFTLPVQARIERFPLESLIFSLSYDASAFEYVDAQTGKDVRRFDLTVNPASPGVLHGLLTGGTEVAASSGEVLSLRFRLRSADRSGNLTFTRLVVNDQDSGRIPEIQVSRNGQTEALPKAFQMTARPNPFNPMTQIEYTIPEGSGPVAVSLRVLDLTGRVVRDLVQAQQGPGLYRSTWDGHSGDGATMASGVYLLQLRAGEKTTTQKAVLLK